MDKIAPNMMDRWQLVQTIAGSEVLQFAVPQKHFHRIFHCKRFERIRWLLFQMHHTCSVQSTKCALEFLPIRGGCPSGSIFILSHNILHNIMLPHFILLLYILCFGELPPDLPRLPGCRSLMEPQSGLELQTIHRISQSRRMPLLGLSPG